MVDTIYTSQTPASDDSGTVTTRSVGMRFQISVSGKASNSARYWVPAAGLGTTSLFYIWNLTGSTRLVEVNLNTALPSPTASAWNSFSLGTTVNFSTGVNYAVGIFLNGASHYVFSGSQTLPVSSGGAVSADQAMYRENGTHDDPVNNVFPGGFYFSDLNVIDSAQSINVGLASEVDSALGFGSNMTVPVGLASERDSALGFASNLTVALGLATEIDAALAIGHTGGANPVAGDLSATYYLNFLAGTLVNGVPTLTAKAAASVWAGLALGAEEPWSYNFKAGNVLPQWKALQGVLNQLAGTTDLSVHDCLKKLAGS